MDLDEALERTQWDLFWVPPTVRVVDRPEVLYLSSEEPDPYLNSVVRARIAEARVDEVVAEVAAAHPTSSRWMLGPLGRTDALEAALGRNGYGPTHEHHAWARACAAHVSRRSALEVRAIADLDDIRAADSVMVRAFGRSGALDDERLAIDLTQCTRLGTRIHRFVAWLDGEPVATAGLNVFPSLDLGLLWGGCTVAEARGLGAYHALLDARVAVARGHGIRRVALYARNQTSGPIVERLGFERHGPMTYWERLR